MRRATVLVIASSLATGMAAACGSDEDSTNASKYEGEKAKVAAVVDELGEASRNGDGARVCRELFTRNLAISVKRAARRPCADEVTTKVFDEDADFEVQDLSVIDNRATARVEDQKKRKSVLYLAKERGRWRIARIS